VLNWSEVVPTEGSDYRAQRAAMLCRCISDAGHCVTWWTSTFDHTRKTQRSGTDACIQINERFTVRLLQAPGYRHNISIKRLWDHVVGAKRFLAAAPEAPKPDLLFVSLPTIEFAAAGCQYASRLGIPVVVDVRDLWPDVLFDLIPRRIQWARRLIFAPYEKLACYSCRSAAGITAPNENYINWALAKAKRERNSWDRAFPLAYTATPPADERLAAAREFWTSMGLSLDKRQFTVCFVGTLGRQFDIETVIEAAAIVQRSDHEVRFVVCGTGDQADRFKTIASGIGNILWPGWVGAAEIWTLMRASHVGLAPYMCSRNFEEHIANKPIEYLSAGLPVLTTLKGALGRLLRENDCGLTYALGSPSELARLVLDLKRQPSRLQEQSLNADRTFKQCFVAEKVYAEMVRYLECVARGCAA
jgi:glycosyltransferase involved in cell wall biosynthesis